jgi:hypothetical protein
MQALIVPRFRVEIDHITGAWIGAPVRDGEVALSDWMEKTDTQDASFDLRMEDDGTGTLEVSALEMVWADGAEECVAAEAVALEVAEPSVANWPFPVSVRPVRADAVARMQARVAAAYSMPNRASGE